MSGISPISLTVNIDRLEAVCANPHQSPDERMPLAMWVHFEHFAMWGYKAAAFRQLAQTLTEAAEQLDAAAALPGPARDPVQRQMDKAAADRMFQELDAPAEG